MSTARIRVAADRRGRWNVLLPDQRTHACETLEDARRVAYQCAARERPCELIVRDAYNRVVEDQYIDVGTLPPHNG